MIANILYLEITPPPTLVVGYKGQNLTFLEHGHVAYQIKGNHTCSNMVTTILPADPNPPPALGVVPIFSEYGHVAYQIKGKWSIEHYASTYYLLTHNLNLWV